jgi:RND superfamily putative drug exporter
LPDESETRDVSFADVAWDAKRSLKAVIIRQKTRRVDHAVHYGHDVTKRSRAATGEAGSSPIEPLVAKLIGRKRAWAILVVWLVIAGLTISWLAKLQDVTAQDASAFLPKSSESAQFVEDQKKLESASTLEVSVSYRRDLGQLTNADIAIVEADRKKLIDHYRLQDADPPGYSRNGHGAIISLSVPNISEDRQKQAEVATIRELLGDDHGGLEVFVTGPGAFVADAENIYGDIDMTLITATVGIVALVLLITYRSPLLMLLPLVAVLISDGLASWLIGVLARNDLITLDGQSAGILPVLVFGVGTDYALLLIARYREELRRHEDLHDAMRVALRRAAPTILASGLTVVLAFLALLATELNSNRALAIVGFVSIGLTVIATCTLLPAMMLLFGRRVFWPLIPRYGEEVTEGRMWERTGEYVARRARTIAAVSFISLAALGIAGVSIIDTNLKQIDFFRANPDSVAGQKQIELDYAGGEADPLLLVANARQADDVRGALATVSHVEFVAIIDKSKPSATPDCIDDPNHPGECLDLNGKIAMAIVLTDQPDTKTEHETIDEVRAAVHGVDGADAVVGSGSAERLDLARASNHDSLIAVPIVLAIAMIVFCALLRSIVAPLVLVLSVLLSYGAALGATVLMSKYVFQFPAIEQSVPFLGFVFLVALGIDYCVFLAIRIRENVVDGMETADATIEALRATGTVITSAGAVLAATFAILAVIPVVSVTQLGFLVAFGVLLDTFVVRSFVVPAVFVWLGDKTWWPAKLR